MTAVSIICTAYKHAPYISDALESFVRQRTDFPFYVWVGDDCSPDGTAEIIRSYAKRYPDIIRPVFHTANIGPMNNFMDLARRADTPYVTLCEGDDYWTDPFKLQKQADFLDSHPQYSVCFHPVAVRYEGKPAGTEIFPSERDRFHKKVFSLDDLKKRNFIPTNSVMYRWRFLQDSLDLIPEGILPGDWFLHMLHAQKGDIGFLPHVMGVYRKHAGSLWFDAGKKLQWFDGVFRRFVKFYRVAEKRFERDFCPQAGQLYLQLLQLSAKSGDFSVFEKIIREDPASWSRVLECARRLKKTLLPVRLRYKLAFKDTVRDEAHWQYQLVKNAKELLVLSKRYGYDK